ncbi:T9SS type B sorting domain-containing protein [Maribacter spongiicola]|uniref:T9SS type B sorting domain-containing protein n=1 Tax=Maribacter spongiicola TaxID=1206753 RepID=UPI003F9B8A62
MKNKKVLLFISAWMFFFLTTSQAQQCPNMTSPLDGDINVPVDNLISWTEVDGIIGYLVSLGTTPGGGEIINRRSSGQNNFYQPEVGLPENTTIYVTISLFLPDAPIKVCPLKVFTTTSITEPPECTSLVSPINGETEVRVDTNIKWNYSPSATNYLISIGTSSGNYDIVENFETGNVLAYKTDQNLEIDQQIFVIIIPVNQKGEATGCQEYSFTTGEPTVKCNLNDFPLISIPDKVPLCTNLNFGILNNNGIARGFRWIKINNDDNDEIVSTNNTFEFDEIGNYRLELYNTISQFGASIECLVTKNFEVVTSNAPEIENVIVSREPDGLRIEILTKGTGEYEYSLDNQDYGYQDYHIFNNVKPGERTVYVRDKFGCGIAERLVEREISFKNFPAFFSPNGDGINDHWQIITDSQSSELNIEFIFIFDRYGNLLKQLNPKSIGWNGNFNGRQVPESEYWFKAVSFSRKEIKGHFSLIR